MIPIMNSPTPDQIATARTAAGLGKTASAALVHSTYRVWLQWESGDRKMHPAFWELFLLKTGQPEPHATTHD